MFRETVSLVLKHSDINIDSTLASAETSVGGWTNGKQESWWNVNLRNLLGDSIYNNHDKFIIRLNQLSHSNSNFAVSANIDNLIEFNMSGLNFVNSTFDVLTGNNNHRYKFLFGLVPSSTAGVISLQPNISLGTFSKSSDNVRIRIELMRMSDNTPIQSNANRCPHMAYAFDIIPIKK